jgi:anti-anti-sigma regulatory factor
MSIRQLEPDVLYVSLPNEPQLRPELALVRHHLAGIQDKDLVVDFSRVEILMSVSIGDLMLLHRLVTAGGGRVVLCGMRLVTKCILRTVGVDVCFDFAEDSAKALKALHEFREGADASCVDRQNPS